MLRRRCLSTMGVSFSARKGLALGSSPRRAHNSHNDGNKHKKQLDPNMSDARLPVNRPCIYERQLPGDAYITAHVQRLQHGYHTSSHFPQLDSEHVSFLAISFVFHSRRTRAHRFKSATIRVRISGDDNSSPDANGSADSHPCFLMYAPHSIFGTVSPETLAWDFSLAGTLDISETPISASLAPSGSVNSQYERYDMMRIQGSVRRLRSPRGTGSDVENGEILWSLEENDRGDSGLPREFTFPMVIRKPSANSNIHLSLDINPIIGNLWGNYPSEMLGRPSYRPEMRQSVDFSQEIGQRFEPADGGRGFNFATLLTTLDNYVAISGQSFYRSVSASTVKRRAGDKVVSSEANASAQPFSPQAIRLPPAGNFQHGYPEPFSPTNPAHYARQMMTPARGVMLAAPPLPGTTGAGVASAMAGPAATPQNLYGIRLGVDPAISSRPPEIPARSPFSWVPVYELPENPQNNITGSLGLGMGFGKDSRSAVADAVKSWLDGVPLSDLDWRPVPDLASGEQSYEAARASMLRSVHPGNREDREDSEDREDGEAPVGRVVALEEQPVVPKTLAAVPEESSEESEEE